MYICFSIHTYACIYVYAYIYILCIGVQYIHTHVLVQYYVGLETGTMALAIGSLAPSFSHRFWAMKLDPCPDGQ